MAVKSVMITRIGNTDVIVYEITMQYLHTFVFSEVTYRAVHIFK
jgi:hypothetical protein